MGVFGIMIHFKSMGVFFSMIHFFLVGVLTLMIHFPCMGVLYCVIHLLSLGVLTAMIRLMLMDACIMARSSRVLPALRSLYVQVSPLHITALCQVLPMHGERTTNPQGNAS